MTGKKLVVRKHGLLCCKSPLLMQSVLCPNILLEFCLLRRIADRKARGLLRSAKGVHPFSAPVGSVTIMVC